MGVSRTLTMANSAATKNALAATSRTSRMIRSSIRVTMVPILHRRNRVIWTSGDRVIGKSGDPRLAGTRWINHFDRTSVQAYISGDRKIGPFAPLFLETRSNQVKSEGKFADVGNLCRLPGVSSSDRLTGGSCGKRQKKEQAAPVFSRLCESHSSDCGC